MTRAQTLWHMFAVFLYLSIMGYATWVGFSAPFQNWDMLGYVGSVVQWKEHDVTSIFNTTMKTMREHVSPVLYADFMSNYLSATDKAFVQQLPIYQVKPFYNGLIWLVHQTGIALPVATWVVSASSFGTLAILLFFWKPRLMHYSLWLAMVVALTYGGEMSMYSLACLSTPDCIATLLTAAAIYSWLMRHSFRMYCLFAWCAVMARPDALILMAAIAAYCSLFAPSEHRMKWQFSAVLIVFLSITYFTVSRLAHNYGLERWFIYAFLDKSQYPAEATDHLTFERYWSVLSPSFFLFVEMSRTIAMLLLSTLACIAYKVRPVKGNRFWLHLMLLIWACITLRFLMFPAWGEDRYYFCYYLPMMFACGELIAPCMPLIWQRLKTIPVQIP